ncbi:MAG: alcohol dehydrogenase catalytic domain-containing protein [Chloroflexota bacterium]|nr:alcohol dehydrogenase catalytic domain-containing protein [Chloroflexota bacterium]
MRRAVFRGSGHITVEDAQRPRPERGELLLRVHACALCGSDRRLWEQGSSVTPGHETAGTVVQAGADTSTPLGTMGAVFLVAFCGRCALCRAGSQGACLRKEAMLGFNRDGGFAEYITVPERCFLPIDSRLNADDAVMLLDVTGTAMHAVRRAGCLESPPSRALVMGAGPVGLGCILVLHAVGVPEVLAVDVAPFRLDFAARLGAEAIAGGDAAVEAVRRVMPEGPDFIIEASGHRTAQRQALDLLAPGGKMVVVGHSSGSIELWASRDLIRQEKMILGSEYFDTREFDYNQQMIVDGRLNPRQVITHRFPLEEIEEAYRLFWKGETGKVLIYPGRVTRPHPQRPEPLLSNRSS